MQIKQALVCEEAHLCWYHLKIIPFDDEWYWKFTWGTNRIVLCRSMQIIFPFELGMGIPFFPAIRQVLRLTIFSKACDSLSWVLGLLFQLCLVGGRKQPFRKQNRNPSCGITSNLFLMAGSQASFLLFYVDRQGHKGVRNFLCGPFPEYAKIFAFGNSFMSFALPQLNANPNSSTQSGILLLDSWGLIPWDIQMGMPTNICFKLIRAIFVVYNLLLAVIACIHRTGRRITFEYHVLHILCTI